MIDTKLIKMEDNEALALEMAAKIWKTGGLVAFPTETVYGLGANGLDAQAATKIYAAKGRPSDNPLILHIAQKEQVSPLVREINKAGKQLMDAFWPGPLTLIFPKADCVPYKTTGGLDTVAIRMPSHPQARKLLKEVQLPIAAPSANLSGRPSPTTAEHVWEDMNGRIELIVDGGAVGIGVESTIVDLTEGIPTILRPGYITKEMLETVVGEVKIDPAIMGVLCPDIHPKAPGMKYRHYAPKAPVTLVEGKMDAVIRFINEQIQERGVNTVGVIATEETKEQYQGGIVKCIGSRSDMESVAHNLYDVLRSFDATNVSIIYSESFSEEKFGQAVMNRLKKAAGQQMIHL
ncbi:Threonylcarbamoyl-AMP synthase [Clostridiales bacterium CHKCI001]|nr:Threonylcarbamoyl-AMP synthase [Clostridiales bacterium CHKCI001]